MNFVQDDELEQSAVVANCRMNRERNLRGSNGYDRELGLDPVSHLAASCAGRPAAWLDLCCGTGRALIQAAEIAEAAQPGLQIVGVDLVGMFHHAPSNLSGLRLVEASLRTWRPDRAFDLITCVHGLHYIGDKLGLITRAASWLTQGGLFLASLDLHNLKMVGSPSARRILPDLRRAGWRYDHRRRLVSWRGSRPVRLPYHYVGADDAAGPNATGQPAVDSYYELVKGAPR